MPLDKQTRPSQAALHSRAMAQARLRIVESFGNELTAKQLDDILMSATGPEDAHNKAYGIVADEYIQAEREERRDASMAHAETCDTQAPVLTHFGMTAADFREQLPEQQRRVAMVDGLLARMDRDHTPTIGREYAHMPLVKMQAETYTSPIQRGGMRRVLDRLGATMSGHTTSDFPLIAGDALNIYVGRRFDRLQPAIFKASHLIERGDYRDSYTVGLSSASPFDVVKEGAEVKHVTMDESGEMNPTPEDVAGIFRLTNHVIQNDATGQFTQAGNRMVEAVMDFARKRLMSPITNNQTLRDGNPVFHASRNNLAASGAAPSVASLSEARLAMRTQKDSQGVLLAIEPWAIVCGVDLETNCQQILASIDATTTDAVNPFAGTLGLIVEPSLPANAWYLIGDPSRYDGLAHATLDGMAAPRVEMKEGWETLGAEYRCVWAFDAKFIQPLSWFKNPGA